MLFKEIVDARTHGRTGGRTTDDGRRTLKDHKSSLSTSCSGELKIKALGLVVSDKKIFESFINFKNLFIDPVTYLCNQLKRFEQL